MDPIRLGITKRTGNKIIDRLIDNMVYVQGGTFNMGKDISPYFTKHDVEPVHLVTLSSFYIGKFQVTQAEWKEVMGNNPSQFIGDQNPVERVSWDNCRAFISKLIRLTQLNFSFPTEAQWEYAAKGGQRSKNYEFSGSNNYPDVAWCDGNSGDEINKVLSEGTWLKKPEYRKEIINRRTHPVGSLRGNELDIYDMSGNVCEWCYDWFAPYSSENVSNPKGPASGDMKVHRGGSYRAIIQCKSIHRDKFWTYVSQDMGLRLALNILNRT